MTNKTMMRRAIRAEYKTAKDEIREIVDKQERREMKKALRHDYRLSRKMVRKLGRQVTDAEVEKAAMIIGQALMNEIITEDDLIELIEVYTSMANAETSKVEAAAA